MMLFERTVQHALLLIVYLNLKVTFCNVLHRTTYLFITGHLSAPGLVKSCLVADANSQRVNEKEAISRQYSQADIALNSMIV